jgi:hypothetical protein
MKVPPFATKLCVFSLLFYTAQHVSAYKQAIFRSYLTNYKKVKLLNFTPWIHWVSILLSSNTVFLISFLPILPCPQTQCSSSHSYRYLFALKHSVSGLTPTDTYFSPYSCAVFRLPSVTRSYKTYNKFWFLFITSPKQMNITVTVDDEFVTIRKEVAVI